jgi:hypothetical protein
MVRSIHQQYYRPIQVVFLVIMDPPSPLPPLPPSPSPVASISGQKTRTSKGKAREDPEIVPETPHASPAVAAHPYALRGTKRRAEPAPPAGPAAGSADSQTGDEDETTPRKKDVLQGADIPQVHVDSPSPPRPTRQARTDDGGAVNVGEVSPSIPLFLLYILTFLPGYVRPVQDRQ